LTKGVGQGLAMSFKLLTDGELSALKPPSCGCSLKRSLHQPSSAVFWCIPNELDGCLPNQAPPALLIVLPPVSEIAHALAPRAVTARLQGGPHNRFHLIGGDTVLGQNCRKANMVRKRHLNDFTGLRGRGINRFRHFFAQRSQTLSPLRSQYDHRNLSGSKSPKILPRNRSHYEPDASRLEGLRGRYLKR
jgi:hypothetical protein